MASMIFRFSLYGFLKNQRYFEAFLVLAFLDKGLDFFQIGLLIALKQLAVNAFEVPSGAFADVFGRRRSMILSLSAYIGSFLALGLAESLAVLAAGMVLYGLGDSFRSGTHKAMIFAWLAGEGREGERVKVYGYTRSWSKFGSALGVVVGAAIVIASDGYTAVFLAATIPYVLGIVNMLGYPAALDAAPETQRSVAGVLRHLGTTLRMSFRRPALRRLVFESMGFDGVFAAVKDYLQPVLEAAALTTIAAVIALPGLTETRSTALLVGPVYIILYLLAGLASRRSHLVNAWAGGEERAARVMWAGNLVVFLVLLGAGWLDLAVPMIVAFVALHVLQNLWRPVLISRFDSHGEAAQGASLLSVESQAQRAATMVLAPLLGLAVDAVRAGGPGGAFWPIGAVGVAASLLFLVTARTPSGVAVSEPATPDRGEALP